MVTVLRTQPQQLAREWAVSIVIVVVSMLTLPHMIVVERLWRHRSAREHPSPLSLAFA